MNNELRVDRYTVNDIVVNYLKDRFYVNRRYQRKLVWGIEEKRLLIDSILKGIPLPAILIAQYQLKEDDNYILEIVDGMQRLNAIITFVLGEFSIEFEGKQCYFDPLSYNETFLLMSDGKLKKNEPLLPKEICQEFCRYQLPAIITGQDDTTIELIFSRINSTGRKISSQDLRQSTSTGEFSDLVRRIASRIRRDYTYDDRICLCDIQKISIGYKKYGYGVDLDTIFWRKHDLINAFNIKESKDEEIIETLIAAILLGKFKKNKTSLDNLYNQNTPLGKEIENKIAEIGKDLLEDSFAKVFDVIDMIFDSVNSDFSSYLFNVKKSRNKDECFKILFVALYRLLSEGYIAVDNQSIAKTIKSANAIFYQFTNIDKVDYSNMDSDIENLYNILKPSLSYQVAEVDSELTKEINKRLTYSKIERQMTEFKIGISDFTSYSINSNVISDIAKTLVAMSNTTNAREEGLLILGIANNKSAYDAWNAIYHKQAVIHNQHYIPGITDEAKKLNGTTDAYYRNLRKLIEKEPISAKLKEYILQTFEPIDYYGKELIIFKSNYMGEISLYDNEKYIRHSNETCKL